MIHKPGMTLIGVQWSTAADKHPRCPDKGATYVGNGGCGSFYALSVTSVYSGFVTRSYYIDSCFGSIKARNCRTRIIEMPRKLASVSR